METQTDSIWLLVVKHNDEDLSILAAFSTKELAVEAKDELRTEYEDVPYRILKIELDPEIDSLF